MVEFVAFYFVLQHTHLRAFATINQVRLVVYAQDLRSRVTTVGRGSRRAAQNSEVKTHSGIAKKQKGGRLWLLIRELSF